MSGNIKPEDIDKIIVGFDALLTIAARLAETSDLIIAGGDDGISDADLEVIKGKASDSFSTFSALIDELDAKKES